MNIWKIKKTTARRIWALLLTVCTVLGCIPIVSLTASAQVTGNGYTVSTGNTVGSNLLGSANSSIGSSATDTGTTGSTGSSATDTGTTGSTESGAGETDSTAGTAYGQDTGSCTCGGHYINGICSNADCTDPYQEPSRDDSDTVFLIENAGNLYWFAKYINSGNGQADAKLTKNITVNASVLTDGNLPSDTSTLKQWTPIGNGTTASYKGTFNGDGHTVSGLYYNGSDSYVGLFGDIRGGARIQNVGVIDSCFQVSGDSAYLGGIVGYVGAYAVTDPITISGCSSAALLAATSTSSYSAFYCGGVVGEVSSHQGTAVTIQNCANTGRISATSASGSV